MKYLFLCFVAWSLICPSDFPSRNFSDLLAPRSQTAVGITTRKSGLLIRKLRAEFIERRIQRERKELQQAWNRVLRLNAQSFFDSKITIIPQHYVKNGSIKDDQGNAPYLSVSIPIPVVKLSGDRGVPVRYAFDFPRIDEMFQSTTFVGFRFATMDRDEIWQEALVWALLQSESWREITNIQRSLVQVISSAVKLESLHSGLDEATILDSNPDIRKLVKKWLNGLKSIRNSDFSSLSKDL